MNVTQIIESVCYEMNVPVPSTLFPLSATTDPAAKQLGNLLYSVARDLRALRTYPQSKKSGSITLATNRDKYPLPEDYYAALQDTQWDQDRQWRMIGPLSDGAFTSRLYGYNQTETVIGYRIFGPDSNQYTSGGQFWVNPTPASSGDILRFEYITKTLFMPKNWTPSTAEAPGNKKNANGNIYVCTVGGTTGTTAPSATSGSITDGTVTWNYVSAPQEEVLQSDDISLYDDDVLIAGVKYKFYQAKGLDYADLANEAKEKYNQAVARFGGSFRGSMSKGFGNWGRRFYPPGEGGWSF